MKSLRELRHATRLSQVALAHRLGVPAESLRAWNSGRRPVPAGILEAARVLAEAGPLDQPLSLKVLSGLIGVSVYRLREAARDGRLVVEYINRAAYGRPVPRATLAAGEAYKRQYFGRRRRDRSVALAPIVLAHAPDNFDQQLKRLRRQLGFSQGELASAIGAAGRAVVYQWECRKRTPSAFFWFKILVLAQSSGPDGQWLAPFQIAD